MIEGIDPEDHAEMAGMLVEVRFDELECFCEDIVHTAFGKAGDGGDLFVGELFFAAESVYLLFLGR